MYYDMNKIVADELQTVNRILTSIEGNNTIPYGTSLYGNVTGGGMSYHLRCQENGVRRNVLLGDDYADEVIRIKQLAYNKELASSLEHNRKLLERVDGKFRAYDADAVDGRLRAIYRDSTGLVNKNPGFMDTAAWMNKQHRSTLPTAEKQHITAEGKAARSKSEIIIHNILTQLEIPFKNDVDINLKTESNEKIYKNADFVMPCKSGGLLVLEHFGMLDNEEYLIRAIHKIRIYGMNGYSLNDRLFISMDGFDGTLNAQAVKDMIEKLILPKVQM